ncbi:hypothetical protein AC578_9060 [Pseudocercospora eumusae]|uniref:Uncharacterized protein n=1 Tax=Pseudocercospora eumusae TaxID=321146 RepID=A0A139H8M8_9PEZI|nr:hypothetical protein AC578_9060 [Pseudocercospora eumusae]
MASLDNAFLDPSREGSHNMINGSGPAHASNLTTRSRASSVASSKYVPQDYLFAKKTPAELLNPPTQGGALVPVDETSSEATPGLLAGLAQAQNHDALIVPALSEATTQHEAINDKVRMMITITRLKTALFNGVEVIESEVTTAITRLIVTSTDRGDRARIPTTTIRTHPPHRGIHQNQRTGKTKTSLLREHLPPQKSGVPRT